MAESLQNLKRRISGVKNVNQITRAMELVAATKMRRSQEIALGSRPYAFAALDLLLKLTRLEEETLAIPLLMKREIKKRLFVLVTSDKGLAGSFNSAVIRAFEKYMREQGVSLADQANFFAAVGQKAAAYLEKRASHLAAKFVRVGDYTTVEEVTPIANLLISGYLAEQWDEVTIFSTHFRTALKQDVIARRIFPVELESIQKTLKEIVPERGRYAEQVPGSMLHATGYMLHDYLIEPSPESVLNMLAEHLVLMQIYHLVLEANASEHAARRAAMKNASDNAEELAKTLSLLYNKSRQAAITKELVEITSGAAA